MKEADLQAVCRWLAVPLVLMMSLPLSAGEEEYDACILQYQKNAKTRYAASLIKQACEKLHKDIGLLFSDEEQYYRCILENIPGVEDDYAIESIRKVCRSQSES